MADKKLIFNGVTGVQEEVDYTTEEQKIRDVNVKAWNDASGDRKLAHIKQMRLERLIETDYLANSDVTMPDNIKTWRQQLRDLPQTYTTEAEYDTLLETEGEFPNQTLKHAIWSKP